MQVTTNYQLPLYEPTDVANLLTGYNAAMNTLDTELEKVSQAAAQGATDIGEIQSNIGKINTEIETLQDEFTVANIPKIKQDITNLQTDVDGLITQETSSVLLGTMTPSNWVNAFSGYVSKYRNLINIKGNALTKNMDTINEIDISGLTAVGMNIFVKNNYNYFLEFGSINSNFMQMLPNTYGAVGYDIAIENIAAGNNLSTLVTLALLFDGTNTRVGIVYNNKPNVILYSMPLNILIPEDAFINRTSVQ